MSSEYYPSFSLEGKADHSGRMSQQGQGYQFNIDQVFIASGQNQVSTWAAQYESWPLVRELDPLEFGVHRAPINQGNAVPPYVTRDVDSEVKIKLQQVCKSGGLVLLIGDSTAGKTRIVYETLQEIAPTKRLFRPFDKSDLRASIVTIISNRKESLVWLDDLEQYLGPTGLTSPLVAYLKRAGVAIAATIRGEQYQRFIQLAPDHVHDNLEQRSDFQRILDLGQSAIVRRRWSEAELQRAAKSKDVRVIEAVQHSELFGIAEYLAAGPRLLDEWSVAWGAEMNPRGASLIATAVDFARAGISAPIPRALLVELHELYLEEAGGALLRPEGLEQAFSWATRRRSGVASPLIPQNNGQSYRAFDYLVDARMRNDQEKPIPELLWTRAIGLAETNNGLIGVASAARRHELINVEKMSWERLSQSGDPLGAMRLGTLHENLGEHDLAFKWYEKAVELGNPDGFTRIGLIHEGQHDSSIAENFYRKAAEAGNAHGMNHLALLLRKQGDIDQSERWYRMAVEAKRGEKSPLDVSMNLASLLAETNRLEEAESIYRKAVDSGEDEALNGLGYLLERSGRRSEALDLWRQAVDKGVANAAANLALDAEERNKLREAREWWQKAIELGSESAVLRLAINLDKSGGSRRKEAKKFFDEAINLEVDGSAYSYAVFYSRQGLYEDAVTWARKSVELREEKSQGLLASILDKIPGSEDEAALWWRQVAEGGDTESQVRLGELLAEANEFEEAVRWLTPAAEGGDVIAACTLGWVYSCLRDRPKAEANYRAAADAGHAHAACNHGSLLMAFGETEAALERFREAYFSGHAHVSEDIEKIYRSTGRGREAAEWLRRSKTGLPNPKGKNIKKGKNKRRKRR
ncbi:tetratricopeptide repeat protein [Amycolatopsis halotolerans]|uniref:Tetratricopeptide repeat protein n=1 Tax=Amycolatopsis halotolerans TaxID=330083 RepID=A0ABV7QKK6_9PSEU